MEDPAKLCVYGCSLKTGHQTKNNSLPPFKYLCFSRFSGLFP